MFYSLLAIVFLAVFALPIHAQEHTWLCSAGGGISIPIAPDDFYLQYLRGNTFGVTATYELRENYAIGMSLRRDEFHHTGRRIHSSENDDRCISGGERVYTMLDATARIYMPIGPNARWYVAGEAGTAWNTIGKVTYVIGTMYEYSVRGIKTINLTCGLKVGAICYLSKAFGISAEAGYGIVEDGFDANQFVPISVSAMIRF
jgi:hypothetical protein